MYQPPRGEARREAILRATVALIGARGTDAVTHRAVAAEAGVPLSATTYWFSSRDDLLEQTFLLAAREETDRLERLVLELAPRDLSIAEWAAAIAATLAGDVRSERERLVALYELALEASRRPALRGELARWQEAQLRVAQIGLRALGSDDPERDAQLVVAALTGLVLAEVAVPGPGFEEMLRSATERLASRLVSGVPVRG